MCRCLGADGSAVSHSYTEQLHLLIHKNSDGEDQQCHCEQISVPASEPKAAAPAFSRF
jgi:hypothetical protein